MPSLADSLLSFIPTDSIPSSLKSYIPGQSPLSTWPAVLSMTATYLCLVFGTREFMKHRASFKLTGLFRAHNLLLSVGSLLLMYLVMEEVISNWPKVGTFGAVCSPEGYTQRLDFLLMVNYYLKYYEYLDTIFLALKKKPLALLHVYHHAATAVLGFVGMNAKPTIGWIPSVLNCGVHVIMYYYYFATAGGAKFWWKKYLTSIQIVQFFIILAANIFASWNYAAYNWWPIVPHLGNCTGTPTIGVVGAIIVLSYVVLFINFFKETYNKEVPAVKGGSANTTTRGHMRSRSSGAAAGSLLLRVDPTA